MKAFQVSHEKGFMALSTDAARFFPKAGLLPQSCDDRLEHESRRAWWPRAEP